MEGLGINWKLLIGQIVNFVILLFLLKRFAYKPFLAVLEQRKKRIEEGIKKADEIEKKTEEIKVRREEILEKAKGKSFRIIKEGEKRAEERSKEIISSAEKEKNEILEKGREEIKSERRATEKNLREEAIKMSLILSEKFLEEKLNEEKDKKIINRFLEDFQKKYGEPR